MKRLVGRFVAVPIRALAELLGIVELLDVLPLWSGCWRLSGTPEDAEKVLGLLYNKHGIERARCFAEEAIRRSKDSRLASAMGFLEIRSLLDYEAATRWLERAKQENCKNQEMLLLLELFTKLSEDQGSETVIEEILSRNDLPTEFTRQALSNKAWQLAEKRQWCEAEKIADIILSVEEDVDGRLIKWVGCLARGDDKRAQGHLQEAEGRLPDAVLNLLVAQGWLFLGEVGRAMEWLSKAEKGGIRASELRSRIGDLARSEEYERYCARRGG